MTAFPPDPVEDLHVRYTNGNEHNPSDPFGRVELELHGDGRVVLKSWQMFMPERTWTARAAAGTLEKLVERVRAAGIPTLDQAPRLPAGSAMRNLSMKAGGQAAAVVMPWHSVPLPHKHIFDLLDSVVRQTSGDSLQIITRDYQEGLVLDAQLIVGA